MRPEAMEDSRRAWERVREVARIVDEATTLAGEFLSNREELIDAADQAVEPLLDEYFDILPIEKTLIDDTLRLIIPSLRPSQKKRIVPTIYPSNPEQRANYTEQLCQTLNAWSKNRQYVVRGQTLGPQYYQKEKQLYFPHNVFSIPIAPSAVLSN